MNSQQIDLFASGLSATDQAHLNAAIRAVKEGRIADALISASLGASDTDDGEVRMRFDRLACALWDAKDWIDAWNTITRLCHRRSYHA